AWNSGAPTANAAPASTKAAVSSQTWRLGDTGGFFSMSRFEPVQRGDSVSGPPPRAGHARAVEQDYDRRTTEWREIYAGASFHDHLIRRRLERTLDLVDGATSTAAGASLDVGCGAGQLVVEMARRGYRAAGCDIAAGMVAETHALLARE